MAQGGGVHDHWSVAGIDTVIGVDIGRLIARALVAETVLHFLRGTLRRAAVRC